MSKYTWNELQKALREVAREYEKNGGSMILWRSAANIGTLREMAKNDPRPLIEVARGNVSGWEIL